MKLFYLIKWKFYIRPLELIGYWCLYQYRKFTNRMPYDFRGAGRGNVISIEVKTKRGGSKAGFTGEEYIEVLYRIPDKNKEYKNI